MRKLRFREFEVLAKSHKGKICQSPSLSIFKAGICPLCYPVLAHQWGLKKMRTVSATMKKCYRANIDIMCDTQTF